MFSFARKIFSPQIFGLVSRRDLLTIPALKGAHNVFKHAQDARRYSLYHGAVYGSQMTGILDRLYDFAVYDSTQGQPSATNRLILALFNKFKNDEPLQPTQNMSLPGWSLTPEIIADILASLHNDTFDNARDRIVEKWRAAHKQATQKKLTEIKVNEVLDLIAASNEECLHAQQPTEITSRILLAFLFRRAESASDVRKYYQQLQACGIALDLSHFDARYSQEEDELLKDYRHQPEEEKNDFLMNKAENIYNLMLADHHTLPFVETQHYGYQGKPKRPDCFESMMHNFLNILLFDHESGRFDFTRLPETLHPEAGLIELYTKDNFQVFQLNTPQNGQAFFDLMSGREGLEYGQEKYEILGHTDNFIAVINSLFGIHAKTLDDLSLAFSDARRTVTFSTRTEGANTEIIVKQNDNFHGIANSTTLQMNQGHCTIQSSLLGYSGSARLERIFLILSRGAEEELARDPLLFSLYASTRQYYSPLLIPRHTYFSNSNIDEISRLQHIALSLNSLTHDETGMLIKTLTNVTEITSNTFLKNVLGFLKKGFAEEETKETTRSFGCS